MINSNVLLNTGVFRLLRKVPLQRKYEHYGRKRVPLRCLTVFLVMLCGWRSARATELVVEIFDIRIEQGVLRIAVCNTREAFELRDCTTSILVEPKIPSVLVRFSDLSKSSYAILIHQDLNENGLLDKSLIGIPQEPIGFSNDPEIMFGPPDFSDALVTLTGNRKISIKLHNE